MTSEFSFQRLNLLLKYDWNVNRKKFLRMLIVLELVSFLAYLMFPIHGEDFNFVETITYMSFVFTSIALLANLIFFARTMTEKLSYPHKSVQYFLMPATANEKAYANHAWFIVTSLGIILLGVVNTYIMYLPSFGSEQMTSATLLTIICDMCVISEPMVALITILSLLVGYLVFNILMLQFRKHALVKSFIVSSVIVYVYHQYCGAILSHYDFITIYYDASRQFGEIIGVVIVIPLAVVVYLLNKAFIATIKEKELI